MVRKHARAIAIARKLTYEYGLDTPKDIDLEAIAMDLGVVVTEGILRGSAARLLRKGNQGVIRVSSDISSEGQKRFCVAHELGHFVVHKKVDQLELCTSEAMVPWYGSSDLELEANAFAAELLMPEPIFRRMSEGGHGPTIARLERLSAEFRTTITATAIRYVEVGMDVCALVVCVNGEIKWFRGCQDFRFRIRSTRTLVDSRTCASDIFQRGHAVKCEEDVPAVAWLDDEKLEDNWTIRETLIPMPNFYSTLSVLWVVPGSKLDCVELESL